MSDARYDKGGYIPAKGDLPTVKVRWHEGERQYWDTELNRWVRILTPEQIREYGSRG